MSQPLEQSVADNLAATPAPPVPRLSIAFLLAEMTVLSVALALARPMVEPLLRNGAFFGGEKETPVLGFTMMATYVINTLLTVSSLAAAFVLWRHRRRHSSFVYQPGHWLHFINTAEVASLAIFPLSILLGWFFSQISSNVVEGGFLFFFLSMIASALLRVIVAFMAYRRSQRGSIWRWYFLGMALLPFCFWFGAFGLFFAGLSSLVPAAFLATCLVLDSRADISRDWLHWFGVIVVLLHRGISTAQYALILSQIGANW